MTIVTVVVLVTVARFRFNIRIIERPPLYRNHPVFIEVFRVFLHEILLKIPLANNAPL
jgi:hypothetical protein